MLNTLFDEITNQNYVCVTPNRRLSHHLLLCYGERQRKMQQNAWQQPNIHPFSQWQTSLWQACMPPEITVLTDTQEICLWQQCLQQMRPKLSLIEKQKHAILTQSAYSRLQAWNIALEHIDSNQHAGFDYFKQAAQLFKQRCLKKNWITLSEQLTHLTLSLEQLATATKKASLHTMPYIQPLILLNFDQHTPQQQRFLESYRKLQTVKQIQWQQRSQPEIIRFQQQGDELESMATWAYQQLSQHNHQPDQQTQQKTIACVIPNIKQTRAQVQATFNRIFNPCPALHQKNTQPAFNISLGSALACYPIIQVALQAICLSTQSYDLATLYPLWQSSYLQAAAQDAISATQAYLQLQKIPRMLLNQQQLIFQLQNLSCNNSTNTTAHVGSQWQARWINHLQNCNHHMAQQLSHSRQHWLQLIYQQLHELGWPGSRTLDSEAYQVVQAFYLTLQNYAAADYIQPKISLRDFIGDIKMQCKQQLFQPQSKAPATVQVLGSLEAAGSLYDAIWISDIHAQQWPASAQPHPFLPATLQREQHMPHASAERELEISTTLLQRLVSSSRHVVLSYADFSQEQPQIASPLLDKYRTAENTIDRCHTYTGKAHPLACLQKISQRLAYHDEYAPPVTANTSLSGGSGLLKSQSQCPFKGFASWRMRITENNSAAYGLSAIDKGKWLHHCLEKFWLRVGNQAQLLTLSHAQLQIQLKQQIKTSGQHLYPQYISHPLYSLEAKRLLRILTQWLALEKKRDYFQVINCEQRLSMTLDNTSMHISVDRIDQDASGNKLVIDYKSGAVKWQDWFGQRIMEPQLPLYSLHPDIQAQAISYACVKPGKQFGFIGIRDDQYPMQELKTFTARKSQSNIELPENMQQSRAQWKQQLQSTLQQFKQGNASVRPLSAHACQYCPHHSLCRIQHAYT